MCASMVDIQSATAEIRRGKKKRRRKKEEQTTGWKYIWPALLHRAAIKKQMYYFFLTTLTQSLNIFIDSLLDLLKLFSSSLQYFLLLFMPQTNTRFWVHLINRSLTDWLTGLRFYIPLDIKYVISEMLFPANLLASNEKKEIKNREK